MEKTSENEGEGLCLMKLWVARDKDGFLALFIDKPFKANELWFNTEYHLVSLNPQEFTEVTWENSPQQVEIKLIDNGNQE